MGKPEGMSPLENPRRIMLKYILEGSVYWIDLAYDKT
jgi:hypothetical protein